MSDKNIKDRTDTDTRQRAVHLSDDDWEFLHKESIKQLHKSRSLVIRKMIDKARKEAKEE